MKRIVISSTAVSAATPAFAHHPNFSWGMIGEHLMEWDHLVFILATLGIAALAYRVVSNRRSGRIAARAIATKERRHDPR